MALILLFALLAPAPPVAQEPDSAEAKKEAKAKAREERIAEYVRKKEERLARREAEDDRKKEEAAAKQTAEELAVPAVSETAAGPEKTDKKPAKLGRKDRREAERRAAHSNLPRGLAKIHHSLRLSEFGRDPTVAAYLDLIEAGDASAQQIAAFGNFLGQDNRTETALAYYDLALSLDDQDTTIWLNAGTLQRQTGNLNAAAGAYVEVLGIDPNHAFAHYNLGAVFDEMGKYDDSVEEYMLALQIDPTLGDPAFNPQVTNNEKLMAVRMMLYKEQAGSLGLPLVTVPNGEIDGGK
jgi:tetratricopeptide (TPR) repeat protein